MHRADLRHADQHQLSASGAFYLPGAFAEIKFETPSGLSEFLTYYLEHGDDSRIGRMHLTPNSSAIKHPVANLRFQFNRQHQVAAAVMLAAHQDDSLHTWVTADNAARHDLELAHDSWNPEGTRFPPDSYVHMLTLRHALLAFAFGRRLPPPPATWREHEDVGWF